MKNACLSILVALALVPGAALAQQPAPKPAVPAPAAPAAPRPAPGQAAPQPQPVPTAPRPAPPAPPGQLVNIRIDVTVSEDGGDAAPWRKTLTLTLADRQPGSIRAFGNAAQPNTPPARLNVDAFPILQGDGRVQAQVTLDYGPMGRGTSIKVEPLLVPGKPLVVSQAADPGTDRKLVVELTATVLK